jgi:hypothetical protein
MARLYDRVLASTAILPTFRHGLDASTVIVADNVAEYWFANDESDWAVTDFPNIMPPLSDFFVEMRAPLGFSDVLPKAWGCRFREIPEHEWESVAASSVQLRGANTRTGYLAELVLMWSDKEIAAPAVAVFIPIGVSGEAVLVDGGWAVSELPSRLSTDHKRELLKLLFPCLLTISFMHCKNVERQPAEQAAALSKKWTKKHGRPLVRYHVLDIDPMRKVLRSDGGSDGGGLKKALHICRGHFATYTEDAPLFGRVTGTFWKPQHVRGNAKSGAVVKDYRVKVA